MEEEIARAVIDGDYSGRSAWDTLVDAFSRAGTDGHVPHTVLVLDNCEHVLDDVASVIADLLPIAPELTILGTSREPIGWVDELRVRVPSLPRRDALALFRQRAELTGYPVNGAEQVDIIATICDRVHNYPLYIRLAAARLTQQLPVMILRGLTGHADDARLSWSHDVRSGVDPRHRGVSDAITWSYQLCTTRERLLFKRLSVFAAGYDTHPDDITDHIADVGADLESIQAICSDDRVSDRDGDVAGVTLAREEIGNLLEGLVDHALVSAHRTSTTVRYSLLESLRAYAQNRLKNDGREVDETSLLADRHLRYFRDKVCHAAAHWSTSEGQSLLGWVRTIWSDIVIALEASLTTPDRAVLGLEICVSLCAMQNFLAGSIRETQSWTKRCLAAARPIISCPSEIETAAMAAIAGLALNQGRPDEADQILESCATGCVADPKTKANRRHTAGVDIGLSPEFEFVWGQSLLLTHQDISASDAFLRARKKFLAQDSYGPAALSEMHAAFTTTILGTAAQSLETAQRYYDRVNSSETPRERSWGEIIQAIALTRHGGDLSEALELERSSLAFQISVGDRAVGMWAVQVQTWSLARMINDIVAADRPDRTRAKELATRIANLAGGTASMAEKFGHAINKMGPLSGESVKAVAAARKILNSEEYAAAEAGGRRLRPEYNETEQLALGTLATGIMPPHPSIGREPISHWNELTRVEQQVAVLAAAGWSNAAIATRRGKSTRTVDAQITAVLRKLAVTSREEIIEHVPHGIAEEVRIEATRQPGRRRRKRY